MLLRTIGAGRCIRQHLGNSKHNHMRKHHHENHEGGAMMEPVAIVNSMPSIQSTVANARLIRYEHLKFR